MNCFSPCSYGRYRATDGLFYLTNGTCIVAGRTTVCTCVSLPGIPLEACSLHRNVLSHFRKGATARSHFSGVFETREKNIPMMTFSECIIYM